MTMDVSAMQDQHGWMIPTRSFLRLCRRTMWRPKVADSLGIELTGAGLLTGAIAFRRLLLREVLAPSEKNV